MLAATDDSNDSPEIKKGKKEIMDYLKVHIMLNKKKLEIVHFDFDFRILYIKGQITVV